MTVVLVHGIPETAAIWGPLQVVLPRPSRAVALPGFGVPRPPGFTGTKDALAEWLADELRRLAPPLDVVGHDIGALLTLRVATAFDVPLRSWIVDVAPVFHPDCDWPPRMKQLQTPGAGEELMRAVREAPPEDPAGARSRLAGTGVPLELAQRIARQHDELMSRSILDFYRSAIPNVAADWWEEADAPTESRGLVLLLPDPPEEEVRSLEVARRLGAETARLDGLDHAWMAQAPARVASVLERFWTGSESRA